jgi:hypothetical protein
MDIGKKFTFNDIHKFSVQLLCQIEFKLTYRCQICKFQTTNTKIIWTIFVHKHKFVQIVNLKPIYSKCCENFTNKKYSFYFDLTS